MKTLDILGYEGLYRITEDGSVSSYEKKWVTGRGAGRLHTQVAGPVSPFLSKFGYLRVNLWKNGTAKKYHIHTLVAKVFCQGYKQALQVNHKDGNKSNNHFSNLEWVTPSQNMKHAFNMGLHVISQATKDAVSKRSKGGANHKAKKVKDTSNGVTYDCIRDAALANNIAPHNLYVYLRGVVKNKTSLVYA